MDVLFTPVTLGKLELRNRIVMAPMTRSRAASGDMPTELMVEYYRQRAGAGLIVSEGIAPSANGTGYCRTPGIYNNEQVAAWKKVTAAVHAEGGLIAAQIMHCGRISHPLNKPPGSETVAPSAIRASGEIYTDSAGMQPFEMPRELAVEEIPGVVGEFANATELALEAGFDGVELHCTSGYLPAQFLCSGPNRRQDDYGGSVRKRVRFPIEVLRAMAAVDGAGRVGLRISPDNVFNDLQDEDPQETFTEFLAQARELDLAYLHAIRVPTGRVDNMALAAEFFAGRIIGNASYSAQEAADCIGAGQMAAVSFGRDFIANPDLVERLRQQAPLSAFDPSTLYTPGANGYTDYPALV
jgi:N-ethylmaleimide reductase